MKEERLFYWMIESFFSRQESISLIFSSIALITYVVNVRPDFSLMLCKLGQMITYVVQVRTE